MFIGQLNKYLGAIGGQHSGSLEVSLCFGVTFPQTFSQHHPDKNTSWARQELADGILVGSRSEIFELFWLRGRQVLEGDSSKVWDLHDFLHWYRKAQHMENETSASGEGSVSALLSSQSLHETNHMKIPKPAFGAKSSLTWMLLSTPRVDTPVLSLGSRALHGSWTWTRFQQSRERGRGRWLSSSSCTKESQSSPPRMFCPSQDVRWRQLSLQ